MNTSNAKDYLPLVAALAEGEIIQVNIGGHWEDFPNLHFSEPPDQYRIKSEAAKLYVATWFDTACARHHFVGSHKSNMIYSFGDNPGFKLHELNCGEAP